MEKVYNHRVDCVKLNGYTDSDYEGVRRNRKSMSSYV